MLRLERKKEGKEVTPLRVLGAAALSRPAKLPVGPTRADVLEGGLDAFDYATFKAR